MLRTTVFIVAIIAVIYRESLSGVSATIQSTTSAYVSASASANLQSTIDCWTTQGGDWKRDTSNTYKLFNRVNLSSFPDDIRSLAKYNRYRCRHPPKPFYWKPAKSCSNTLKPFNRLQLCQSMKGRNLVFMGDSLSVDSFWTLVMTMSNGNPINGSLLVPTHEYHRIVHFDKVCQVADYKPFSAVLIKESKLELSKTWMNWVEKHPDSVVLVNRGVHGDTDSNVVSNIRVVLNFLIRTLSPEESLLIWRTVNIAHVNCGENRRPIPSSRWKDDFIDDNPYHREWNWKKFPVQSQKVVLPMVKDIIAHNNSFLASRFVYLDVFESIKLRADGHHHEIYDCLHYCVPGPLDSWIIFLFNIVAFHQSGS